MTEFYNEMFDQNLDPRRNYKELVKWLEPQPVKELNLKCKEAEELFRRIGITFNTYEESGDERLIPFDMIPRILSARQWEKLEKGLKQRITAINMFLHDIYHGQEIIRAGKLPLDLIENNAAYLKEMVGFTPPGGVYTHIAGIDIIRTSSKDFLVLEDNVRTPSGVSYMLENRETMLHMFPELFTKYNIKKIGNYPQSLRKSLELTTNQFIGSKPVVAVLTPGTANSAYYEHAFLADQMGIELIEGHDCKIVEGKIAMRTTQGYKPIDVLYRRIDDDFLDPLTYNPRSQLGIAGLMDVYKSGKITLANAPGSGIADDKAMYSFIPDMIKFYLGEEPLLKNVKTWRCSEQKNLDYVMANLEKLVIKEVHGSGGYGMLIGPLASKRELSNFRKKIMRRPSSYIAQPTLALSTLPILARSGLAPRHIDLRPFVLTSPKGIEVTSGGLTRVALKEGSLVVNSSQGGGTKDTWVLE